MKLFDRDISLNYPVDRKIEMLRNIREVIKAERKMSEALASSLECLIQEIEGCEYFEDFENRHPSNYDMPITIDGEIKRECWDKAKQSIQKYNSINWG